jgi:hypothetical protein
MSFGIRKKTTQINKPQSETDRCKIIDKIMDLEPVTRNKIGDKYIYLSKFKYDPVKHPDVKRDQYLSEYKSSLIDNDSIKEDTENFFFDIDENLWKLVKTKP